LLLARLLDAPVRVDAGMPVALLEEREAPAEAEGELVRAAGLWEPSNCLTRSLIRPGRVGTVEGLDLAAVASAGPEAER
jgi:hypothetical protein